LELSGIGLSGRTSRPLLDLTMGEEEPFTGNEIASRCKVLQTKTLSDSMANVLLEYHVIGKLTEDEKGLKHILKADKKERIHLHLSSSHGTWRITRKSLMEVPLHATAEAWAKDFQDMLKSSDKSQPDLDQNLESIVAELRQM
jgi:hypothetical protein